MGSFCQDLHPGTIFLHFPDPIFPLIGLRAYWTLGEKLLDRVLRMQHIGRMKTAAVHSRIQPEIKEQAEGILHRLGLSPTEAIRMFYTQITLRNGLPFDVAIPNDVTIKALEESRNGRNLERFDSTEELFESWNA
jgi:DNA-damage-inducible protein J